MLRSINEAKLDAKRLVLAAVENDIKKLDNTIKKLEAQQKELLKKRSDVIWDIWELETGETYEEFDHRRNKSI